MMKKRALTLILAAVLCLSTVLVLASCGSHTFKEGWDKDATHHWHACEDEGCTEVSDKAEHTWDEGSETTFSTDTADGVWTYTCTVCKQTRTEPTKFNGVNALQFGEAVAQETLNSVTVKITVRLDNQAEKISTLEIEGDKYKHVGNTHDDAVNDLGEDANHATALRNQYLFFSEDLYQYLTYDATREVYTVSDEAVVSFDGEDGSITTYTSIKMQMSGSRIVKVEAALQIVDGNGAASTGTILLELSEYGTTAVEVDVDDGEGNDPNDPGNDPEGPDDYIEDPDEGDGNDDPDDYIE